MAGRIYGYMPKYMRKKAERVNIMIDAWDAAGLTSNDLELAKELLSDFYENIGKTPKDTERASERLKLKRSEKEEYNKILDFIIYNDEIDISKRTLKNQQIREIWTNANDTTFDKVSSKYGDMVRDEQDFINFVDRMNKTKNNRLLSTLLDSHQFATLYEMGYEDQPSTVRGELVMKRKKVLKETEINAMIIREYNKTGKTFDALYETIVELIESR